MKTIQTVKCELPGLEAVEVDFDMMASWQAISGWYQAPKFDASLGVVSEIRNWPAATYGENPYGDQAPMAFHVWLKEEALWQAIREYRTDPNWSTGRRRSTSPTPTGE